MGWQWLKQDGAARVVVVFGGWGFGARPFEGLSGADVLFSDDLADLPPALPEIGQAPVDAVAWSFGVATMGHWCARFNAPFTSKTALCGSLQPVDRRLGIPPRAFDVTRNTLSPETFTEFAMRCCDGAPDLPPTDIPALSRQLQAVAERGPAPDPGFDRVVIATRDRVFPAANLRRAWAGAEIVEIDAPHMPFDVLRSWDEVTG